MKKRKFNPEDRVRRRRGPGAVIFSILLWIYAFISLYPMLWMILYSFKSNEEIFVTNPFGLPIEWKFSNYVNAWTQYDVPLYFRNSVIVGIAAVAITIVCAAMFTFAVARLRWRGQQAARTFISLGMFIPVQAIMAPLVGVVRAMGLLNTLGSLIFPYAAINLAFACMVYYGFFKGIPREMEEAACMDGANIYQTFFRIIIPLVAPATITILIYVFLSCWNEFILANVLVGTTSNLKTLPLGVLFFQGQFTTDWGSMGATMVIASLPAVLLYCLFSERVEQAMTVRGAVKG